MRRFLWLLILSSAFAQNGTYTQALHLYKPALHENYGAFQNANWDVLESAFTAGLTVPGLKVNTLSVPGLSSGLCMQTSAGGQIGTSSTPCFVNNFIFSGTNTQNIASYDPLNFVTNQLICRNSSGDLTTTGCPSTNPPVASVFGRIGAITANNGDYSIGQIGGMSFSGTNTTNFVTYGSFTGGAGSLTCKDANGNLTTACATFSGTNTGNIATYDPANFSGSGATVCRNSSGDLTTLGCSGGGTVSSIFGRTGAVTAQSGDYSIDKITGMNFSGTSTTNFMTYGTITGSTGALLCKDANGNVTTTGCSTAGGSAVVVSPAAGVSQTIAQASGTNFNVNLMESQVFADQYAPSSSGGINEAFAACPNSGKCRVWAGIGTITACSISIPQNSVLSGHGRGLTILQCGTPSAPVIADMASNSRLDNLTVQHSTSPTSGGDGVKTSGDRIHISNVKSINNYENFRLGGVTYGVLENVVSEQGNDDCLLFDTSLGTTTMQWIVVNGLFQKCAWGIDFVNGTATNYTAPRITGNTHVFGNHLGGVRISATSTGRIDNFQLSGCNLSQNDGDSVLLDTNGFTNGVADCHIEQSGGNLGGGTQVKWGFNGASGTGVPSGIGNGINITANCDTSNGSPYLISGNRFYQDSDDSVVVLCPNSQIVGNNIYDPGYSHLSGGNANVRAGIAIEASRVQATGNFCTQGGSRSLSCIDISNNADKPYLVGNSYGSNYTDSTMVSLTTTPTNGFRAFLGDALWIQASTAASGTCINGSLWTRIDTTGGMYLCVNGSWVAK